MNKPISLFRFFDLPFLLPGFVMLLCIYDAGQPRLLNSFSDLFSNSKNTVYDVLLVFNLLMVLFVAGLIVHAVQRLASRLFRFLWNKIPKRRTREKAERAASWFTSLAHREGNSLENLAFYFWYMRSLCWNLVTAVVIGCLPVIFNWPLRSIRYTGQPVYLMGILLERRLLVSGLICGLLIFLGFEFSAAMKRAAQRPASLSNRSLAMA